MSKKLRNRFLALVCLLVFLAVGVLFYVNWVVQKPFAIVLFLSDNLSPSVLTSARIYAGGADFRFEIEKFPHLALLTTQANDFAVSDSAAAAGAIATGQKPNNRTLRLEASRTPLPTLLELARKRGRVTGIVSNTSLTDATAAAFYAKTSDPLDFQTIGLQLVGSSDVNVLLGGGAADFLPETKDGRRKDGRDLILEMRNKGYDIVRNQQEMESTPLWHAPKILGLFSMGRLAFADEVQVSASQPSLSEMVLQAILLLQYNPKGYLLVVDAGLSGKASSQNEGERTLKEIAALDQAVSIARKYAGENALIVVAGKQNSGGLRLNGYSFRNDKGAAILGINAQGVPSLTWSTGPGSGQTTTPDGIAHTEPSAFKTASAVGAAEDAVAVSAGPGSEEFTGFRDNTDIFDLIRKG
ncbi:MAG: alkaline phosphatase, partial [Terrimicrobiaceae bacterium]|nr:alkaline phosphatase [Terrimicrobiaceae bacterium]